MLILAPFSQVRLNAGLLIKGSVVKSDQQRKEFYELRHSETKQLTATAMLTRTEAVDRNLAHFRDGRPYRWIRRQIGHSTH